MASPTSYVSSPTGDTLVDASTSGWSWQTSGSDQIYWSFSDGWYGEYWSDPNYTYDRINLALTTIEQYIPIDFVFTNYYATPAWANYYGSQINVSLDQYNVLTEGAWAVGNWPTTQFDYTAGGYAGKSGDVYLNLNSPANYLSYELGSQGWFLLLHELGHALGLKHTHDAFNGRPSLSNIGLSDFDKDWFSMMSYEDDYDFNQIQFDPVTPMVLDVIGLQALYGKNMSTNAGTSTYWLDQYSDYHTIWDAGGTDTVDARLTTQGWYIELPDTVLSPIVGERFGYATPLSQLNYSSPFTFIWLEGNIENANGSVYADTLLGNSLNNTLYGNAGNDTIDGGEGTDRVVFTGPSSDYSFSEQGLAVIVQDSISRRDDTDTVYQAEYYAFSNGTFQLSDMIAPSDVSEGIYRFYNVLTGTHFYSNSATERDYVIDNIQQFNYEGIPFRSATPGYETDVQAPVFRFYNTDAGTHFFTQSEAERDVVISQLPSYTYEGEAYSAYTREVTGSQELYRLFNNDTGTHFYTVSESERDSVVATLPQYTYEGIAYWVNELF